MQGITKNMAEPGGIAFEITNFLLDLIGVPSAPPENSKSASQEPSENREHHSKRDEKEEQDKQRE